MVKLNWKSLTNQILSQELSEGYDAMPEEEKTKVPVAQLTGFMTQDNERRFIIDQNNQLDLTTMSWFDKDNLGTIYEILILYAFRGCSCISCSYFILLQTSPPPHLAYPLPKICEWIFTAKLSILIKLHSVCLCVYGWIWWGVIFTPLSVTFLGHFYAPLRVFEQSS